jgi:hypothetical protein
MRLAWSYRLDNLGGDGRTSSQRLQRLPCLAFGRVGRLIGSLSRAQRLLSLVLCFFRFRPFRGCFCGRQILLRPFLSASLSAKSLSRVHV